MDGRNKSGHDGGWSSGQRVRQISVDVLRRGQLRTFNVTPLERTAPRRT
ncbi:MAG TPA: hypothetical protein VJQ55_15655 [Candidatus Binatia bacterium]|nr:hypothetical protein [Candidatus Binatia bacterium]